MSDDLFTDHPMPIPFIEYRPSTGTLRRLGGSLGTVAMVVVGLLAEKGIAVQPIGIALVAAAGAVVGVVLLVSSGEGIRRDVSVALLCLSIYILWSDPFKAFPIAVPGLWRQGGSAILISVALFFAFRARRKAIRLP